MIADLISNVTPKGPMNKDIKLACFLNSKLLISDISFNMEIKEIFQKKKHLNVKTERKSFKEIYLT